MPIEVTDLAPVGHGIERPKHVVVTSDRRLFESDRGSGVAQILGENSIRRIGNAGGDITPLLRGEVDGQPLKWLNYSSGALWYLVSTATVSHIEIDFGAIKRHAVQKLDAPGECGQQVTRRRQL